MTKARALYEAGDYPNAIAELETARALDPYAKDLVFNLGIVHEKALHIDEALHFYRLYLDMDLEPGERARAESIVKRLEGARAHVQPTASTSATATISPQPSATVIVQTPPAHGRFDGLTATMGVFALAGIGVGTGFGILALSSRPPSNYVTGGPGDPNANGTYAQLKSMVDQANVYAIIADIGFAAGIVFTGVTLGVFFGRTKKSEKPQITISPTARGFALGGTF